MQETDDQRACRASDLIEAALVSPRGLSGAFSEVAALLGARMIHLYNFTDMTSPRVIVAPDCESFQQDYLMSEWYKLDVYSQRAAKIVLPGRVYSDRSFVSDEVRARDPFFQDFCRKWDVGEFTSCSFDMLGQKWSLTMMAPTGLTPDNRQLDLYRRIFPSVNRAVVLSAALKEARARGIAEGIERSGRGAIVLDHEGRAVLITPSAERLMGRDFSLRDRRLASENPGNDQLLKAVCSAAHSRQKRPLQNFLLMREDGSRPVLMMPMYWDNLDGDNLPGASIVLVLIDLNRRNSPTPELLRHCFGLTNRESELARRLSEGRTLVQCSESLGISQNTVRQMMKALLLKSNTHSQVELVALLRTI